MTSPEPHRMTGCGMNDVTKPIRHGAMTVADVPSCGKYGWCISGLESWTLFACILSNASQPLNRLDSDVLQGDYVNKNLAQTNFHSAA